MLDPQHEIREDDVFGITHWHWIKGEHGLWNIRDEFRDVQLNTYLEFVKDRRKLCIQAGGAMGMYPRVFSEYFDVVYTFEPNSTNFYYLNLNCNKENIIKINGALGKCSGFIEMNDCDKGNRGMFTVNPDAPNPIVPVFAIDDFNFPACDFIQLDVENYEDYVIKGAERTIAKYRPVISLECGNVRPKVSCLMTLLDYIPVGNCGADAIFIHKDMI